MTGFRLTPEAKRHLSGIWAYSADLWGARRADKYLRAINETVKAVATGRKRARPCEEYGRGLRRDFPALKSKLDLYVVVGVLHQQMDPVRHLSEREGEGDG